MCIRDSRYANPAIAIERRTLFPRQEAGVFAPVQARFVPGCLLYTSDAADERSSVDLGGRRIIKKKTELDSVVGNIDAR